MPEQFEVARLLERAASEIEYLHKSLMERAGICSDGESNSVAVELRAALASRSSSDAQPVLIAWWDKSTPSGFRWREGIVRGDVPDGTPVYAGRPSSSDAE
jgi:hypothetical protein